MPVFHALVVMLVVNQAPPLTPAPRNPPASAAPAAQVVVVVGNVTGSAGQASFAVSPGTLLDRRDVLHLEVDAWVTLALVANGHVVRLDDQMSLPIEKIALLNAPATSERPQDQLDRLLTPTEKKLHAQDRMIGWHQGQSAANTRGAGERETKKRKEGARETDDIVGRGLALEGSGVGGGGRGRSMGAPNPAPAPAPESVSEAVSAEPPASAPPASAPPASAPPAPPPPPPKSVSAEQVRPPAPGAPAPKQTARLALERPSDEEAAPQRRGKTAGPVLTADEALRRCVAEAAAPGGSALRESLGGTVTVWFRLHAGEARVSTRGNLPMRECLAGWARAHQAQLTPQWTQVVVPLK